MEEDRVYHNSNSSWIKKIMEEAFGGWDE